MEIKKFSMIGLLSVCMCVACSSQEKNSSKHSELSSNNASEISSSNSEDVTNSGTDISKDISKTNKTTSDNIPDTSTWAKKLLDEGSLTVDLDKNSSDDEIVLSYNDTEENYSIKEFYASINGKNKVSLTNDFSKLSDEQKDMTLEDIMAFDFNSDLTPEYVFIFDTHGCGGNGSHEAWILWSNDTPKFEKLSCLDYYKEGEEGKKGGLDTLYKIEHVDGDSSKMKTYQYTYNEGHSDYQGDLVSLIEYDTANSQFKVSDSWTEQGK